MELNPQTGHCRCIDCVRTPDTMWSVLDNRWVVVGSLVFTVYMAVALIVVMVMFG